MYAIHLAGPTPVLLSVHNYCAYVTSGGSRTFHNRATFPKFTNNYVEREKIEPTETCAKSNRSPLQRTNIFTILMGCMKAVLANPSLDFKIPFGNS